MFSLFEKDRDLPPAASWPRLKSQNSIHVFLVVGKNPNI